MAISHTQLTSGTETSAGASSTTASVAPTNGALVIVTQMIEEQSGATLGSPTAPSGLSTTWRTGENDIFWRNGAGGSYAGRLAWWYSQDASWTSGTIQINQPSVTDISWWSVDQFTGVVDDATNFGDACIVSEDFFETGTSTSASDTLTLTGSKAANAVLSGCFMYVNTISAESGWTDVPITGNDTLLKVKETLDSSITWSGTATYWGSYAVEIKAGLPTFDQDGFRFYADNNTDVNSATALAAEDTNITRAKLDPFQARIQVDTGDSLSSSETYKLQWRKSGGSWQDVTVA